MLIWIQWEATSPTEPTLLLHHRRFSNKTFLCLPAGTALFHSMSNPGSSLNSNQDPKWPTKESVYDEGGRSFWIHNTGPLGCLPYILVGLPNTTGEVDHVGCGLTFNEVAQYFNKKLKDTLVQLRRDLPLAAFTYVDVYSVKYHLISNAKKYGFQHPLKSCCGQGGKYNFNRYLRCGATEVINGTEILIVKSCKKPMQSISWDGVHFTEAANKWVLNQIVGGAFSDPPIPLKRACHKKA
eukprot:TRINITY_DN3281_c0_g1_i3.p1 TRINITY_DN3281_c0_g1~~TRINITY_DN3281_c0_g1_i3.p1  ORF type:complete len:239 (+),score=33.03 TRINITY_DN3281_c0_g1_i3:319-1035(+)